MKTKKLATHATRKPTAVKKPAASKTAKKKTPPKNSSKIIKKKQPSPIIKAPKKLPGIPEILRNEALKVLDDRQGEDIVTIDLTDKSSVADYLIVASGRSARQIAAIAHYLREVFMKHGLKNIRVEGLPEGNWVVVDGGDVIVHLFRPEVRSYYDLEAIWDKRTLPKTRAG